MAARIPGARFVTVPRGGHVFMHRDQTALAEVTRFPSTTTMGPHDDHAEPAA
jgi:hypothetical protein